MPDIVLTNKNPKVGDYVLSVPNGVDVDQHIAEGGWEAGGWSRKPDDESGDKPKRERAEVPSTPAAPVNPEGR